MINLVETWYRLAQLPGDDRFVRVTRTPAESGPAHAVHVSLYATMISPQPLTSVRMVVPESVGSYGTAALDAARDFCAKSKIPDSAIPKIQAVLVRMITG